MEGQSRVSYSKTGAAVRVNRTGTVTVTIRSAAVVEKKNEIGVRVNKDRKDGEGGIRRIVSERGVQREVEQEDEEVSASYTVWMYKC